jgi:hypothetical protein
MTVVKTFRKKPVEIEAMQWDGTAAGATTIIDWVLSNGGSASYICSDTDRCVATRGDCPHWIQVRTPGLLTPMLVHLDEWIVRGADGEFFPSKPDFFADTYEEVQS